MTNVLLVEDTRMGRDCIAGYVRSSGRYRLAAAISSAGMAEITCMHTPVDLILMDYRTENNEDGNSAIAQKLHISVHDVKWHIQELFSKTGYNNRVALVGDVINKDFIVPGL